MHKCQLFTRMISLTSYIFLPILRRALQGASACGIYYPTKSELLTCQHLRGQANIIAE